jgi:hypothetical protein
LADCAEIHESAVISETSLRFGEFLLRNQERGEKCKKQAATGVKTPGRPPRLSESSDRFGVGLVFQLSHGGPVNLQERTIITQARRICEPRDAR